jgi:hypothetical protein
MKREARRRVMHQLWLVNVLISTAITTLYLTYAPDPRSFQMGVFLYVGALSCGATLSLPAGILIALASRILSPRVLAPFAAFLWTLTHLLQFVDTLVYGIFRYHINGMVWNVLTTAGAGDAVHITTSDKLYVGVGALVLLGVELLLVRFLAGKDERRTSENRATPTLLCGRRVWGLIVVPAMFVVGGIYARADFMRDRTVTGLERLYPILPRVTVKRFARKWFDVKLEERPRVDVAMEGILLSYPRQAPTIDPEGPRPNIVVIVVDSLREDMLNPETMPHVSARLDSSRVFHNHLSSGNATRFGLFGMLYGLHGSYWRAVYNEQRSPVLIDQLIEQDYDLQVLSSASMNYPEFRSTAWVRIEEDVDDRILPKPGQGLDDGVAEHFAEWLARPGAGDKPFFSFLLLDAPHQSYAFTPEFAVFEPFADDVSYLELARAKSPDDIELIKNRYKNAVLYSDDVVRRLLATLSAAGELDDTIVVITGDHGEEFLENGYMGHTSNFTLEQLHVPFLMFGPGIAAGDEHLPTSHIDLPATLLEALGADPAQREEWSLGGSLLAPEADRRRVASGWDDLAVYTPGGILHVPLAGYGGSVDVYDARWQLVTEDGAILKAEAGALVQLALDCRRFLR